ncbi:MAG: nuclear transport factor 2 family protein [Armatimonadetes bacterium]|nr:nuclear transport factor 2 family protein [Armatimonadota bacterium]
MRLNRIFTVALALSVVTLGFAERVPQEWVKRYQALSKTITSLNFDGFKKFVADDYVWVKPDGTQLDREQSLAEFASLFTMKKITGGETVLKVTMVGDTVDVDYRATWNLLDKKGSKMKFEENGTDSWKQVDGVWKIYRTVDH